MPLQYIKDQTFFYYQDRNHYNSIQLYYCLLLIAGYEEKIKMNRTEIDVFDHLITQIHYLPRNMKRITSGSRKEGLRISSSDIDLFFYLTNHHVVWDITQSVYDTDSETVFFYGIPRRYTLDSLAAIDEHASIK